MRPQIGEEKFGFVAEKGLANALLMFRILAKRALEGYNDVYAGLVNYEKAFDKV